MPSAGERYDRLRLFELFALVAVISLAGALLGCATHAINVIVSAGYYRSLIGWHDTTDIWHVAVARGARDGLLFGLLGGVVFAAVVVAASAGRMPYRFAARHVGAAVKTAFSFWILGGIAAVLVLNFLPETYSRAFPGSPREPKERGGYAWAAGSLRGLAIGAAVALPIAAAGCALNWRRLTRLHPWPPTETGEPHCGRCWAPVLSAPEARCPACGADLQAAGVRLFEGRPPEE